LTLQIEAGTHCPMLRNQSHNNRAHLALLFTTLIWGVTPVFVRAFSLAAGPTDALVIRTAAVAAVFVAVMWPISGFSVARRDLPRLLWVSLIGLLGYFAFSVYGFVYAPAGIGTLIMSTQPLLIALLARAAGTDTLTAATVIGLAISFAGSVLLVSGDDLAVGASSSADVVFGCILIFFAGVAWAIFVVFSKPLIQTYGALKITGLSNIIIALPFAVLPFLPTAVTGINPLATLQALTPQAWGSLAFLTFLGATLSVVTWNYAAGLLRPSLLGASLYVVPVLAVGAGWAMLDEKITVHIIISAAIILLGVAISQYRGKPAR
jgi:drug/metabolite transporter (DMT)-like permease